MDQKKLISCPCCKSCNGKNILKILNSPSTNIGLLGTRVESKNSPSEDIEIILCEKCNHIYNRSIINNSYDFTFSKSPWFENKASIIAYKDSIRRLSTSHGIVNKNIIEIGSGSGKFLKELSLKNICYGYDPTTKESTSSDRFTLIKDFFPSNKFDLKLDIVDFIIFRHVIEHYINPREFLFNIINSIPKINNLIVMIEVPNVIPIIENQRINDFIHEHISYFSKESLINTFDNFLEPIDSWTTLNNENLITLFKYNVNHQNQSFYKPYLNKNHLKSCKNLKISYQTLVTQINELINDLNHLIIWGAGGRGTSLINILYSELKSSQFSKIIATDSDNKKHNLYVPICGLKVYDFYSIYKKGLNKFSILISTTLGVDSIIEEISETLKDNNNISSIYIIEKGVLKKLNTPINLI